MENMNVNPEFQFEILINEGEWKGKTVFLHLSLEDLLEFSISDYLIDEKYLNCYTRGNEYTILIKEMIR